MPNIIQLIEDRLGYPSLEKVNPNTQETKTEQYPGNSRRKLSQAAIPAVLISIIRYFRNAAHTKNLAAVVTGNEWLNHLFGDKKDAVVQKVAGYAETDSDTTETEMEKIASTAIDIIREKIPEPNTEKINDFLGAEHNNILTHLPASMQLGQLLGDDTIDDRTNKMQGTVSTLLHKIEETFTKPTKTKNWPISPDTPHN